MLCCAFEYNVDNGHNTHIISQGIGDIYSRPKSQETQTLVSRRAQSAKLTVYDEAKENNTNCSKQRNKVVFRVDPDVKVNTRLVFKTHATKTCPSATGKRGMQHLAGPESTDKSEKNGDRNLSNPVHTPT